MPTRLAIRPAARGVVWAVVAAMTLTACQTARHGGYGNLSSDQEALRSQADENFNETVGTGAAIGALLGGVLGALADSNNRGRGAMIGAAAGAAVGAGSGYYIASQNERYATREQALNARIRAADQEVARYQNAVGTTQRVVAQQRQRLRQLDAQYRAGRIGAEQYRGALADAKEDANAIRTLIGQNQQTSQAMEQDIVALRRQGEDTRALEQRLAQLQRTQQELRNQYDQLANAMSLTG